MPTPFYTGYFQVNWMTQGVYDAVKDNLSPYQLYLMQDTNNAYLGRTRLFDMFHLVDDFDEPYRGDIKPKSLCVKLTQGEDGAPLIEAKILQEDYTFTELVPPVMGEIVDEDLPEDRTVPTRRAVWKFVDDRLVALRQYFDALENRVVGYMERAETAAVNAEASETAAANSATAADNSATESESYARGGTGTRQGEDTDNAKYYMEQAQAAAGQGGGSAEEARRQAEKAAQSASEALTSEQNAKASENAAALSEQKAHGSEVNAAASAVAAAGSAADAAASAVEAHASEVNAAGSETAASASAGEAAGSARDAATSAGEAAQSELNAATSESEAAASAAAALASEGKAKTSEQNAAQSEANALSYKNAASGSANAAAASAAAALASEGKAKTSEQNAAASETAAANSATAAEQSAISAYNSKNDAAGSATAAHNSEVAAAASESQVAHDASEAASSAAAAEQSEQNAAGSATLSESWAVGDTGVRQDEDTNNAKYWAEQARQASPDGKADKVIGATAGDLAGLDSTGNLTDSGIPSDNVALQDGSYDTLHSGTAGNLVDDRAPSTNRKFGFDTACGDVSISDDGTADPTLLKGTTYVKNQLVGDSKVVKDIGQGVVTSPVAVAGDIDHAYIKGRSLVRNQLVPASMEKEGSSATGVVEVSDAVAGDALALKMVAPRSVVVNQLMDSSSDTGWITPTGSGISTTFNSGVFTITSTNSSGTAKDLRFSDAESAFVSGHVYAVSYEVKNYTTSTIRVGWRDKSTAGSLLVTNNPPTSSDSWKQVTIIGTATTSNGAYLGVFLPSAATADSYCEVRNMMCVDLTQYFNGDQTLIDSITSWDDLAAYDPRFASYVEYNTGTVEGVQPSVYVGSPNLFNIANLEGAANISISGTTITLNATNISSSKTLKQLVPSAKIGDRLYLSFEGTTTMRQIFLNNGSLVKNQWLVNSYHTISDNAELNGIVKFYAGQVGETITNMMISLAPLSSYEPYHDGGTAQAPAPLFAVGNAADEYEAVAGVTTRKMASVDFANVSILGDYVDADTTHPYGYALFRISSKESGRENILCAGYSLGQNVNNNYLTQDKTIIGSASNNNCYLVDSSLAGMTAEQIKTALTGKTIYYELATPTTSTSTPTQISLQAGTNVAMQTDGGRIASSLALGYDGTSFDVPLKTGRSYLVKKGSTSTLVTDGTTQSVTGGQDMIVDLNTLYNNVSSLITPIADWNALVSDTGMYGSYTAYDEGTVVHSDQTVVKVTGKNLFDALHAVTIQTGGTITFTRGEGTITGTNASTSSNTISLEVCPIIASMIGQTVYASCVFNGEAQTTSTSHLYFVKYRNNTPTTVQSLSYTIVADDVGCVLAIRLRNNQYTSASDVYVWSSIQVEFNSQATAYEPYFDGGTATGGLLKGVPGSVYDQLDAVTGNVTTRIGSYTFTGNETWTESISANVFLCTAISNAYRTTSSTTVAPFILSGYKAELSMSNAPDMSFTLNSYVHSTGILLLKDTSCSTTSEIAAKMAGKTVYYRLATYTKSTTTPQPLTQPTGGLTVLQTAGTLPVPLDIRHAVSEWDEPIVRNCKYIFRDNGVDSLVTGSTTVTYKHVVGGQNKLINLTQWFGRNREPSIADFYRLFPTWKDADIPYDRGTPLNYKGTGVRTIGFNAYNHATGTAVLLGGNQYQICGTYTSCSYTDQWGNAEELDIDAQGIFTPVNNGTLTVVGGNDTDTCVHLTWSGYKNFGQPDYEWFPYEEKGVEWDLSQWFPNGMNGIGTVQDEMTNNSMTQKWGIKVFDGTEAWQSYSSIGFNLTLLDMKSGTAQEGACNYIMAWTGDPSLVAQQPIVRLGANNKTVYFWYVLEEGIIESVDDWKAYLASLYAAGTPLILIYPLATPVTSEVAPTQNFSYPVNDFGTEQSLPVNTLTLVTTDLDADIRYSLDFTRTVANYSKIENDVKQLVKEKDNLARQDGNYGDKGGVFNYATQLLDPNAPPTEASYGNRTAAGDVSIADNGTADVTSLQGTTQIQNQLVHDTNMNTKSSVDGRLVLTDAVGGQLSRLEIHGGCVVHNQLVKESVEKTATGTGRLGCDDGVAGNAKSLVMTAPRSVVVNQLVQNGATFSFDFENTGSSAIYPYMPSPNAKVNFERILNHVYLIKAFVSFTSTDTCTFYFTNWQAFSLDSYNNYFARVTNQATITINDTLRVQGLAAGKHVTGTLSIMCVDLTQYFNGNTTLINSINTWDDLVAYDSTFASYVPYDTGTVKGVQPTVKVNHTTDVACPVELFGGSNSYTDAGDSFEAVSGVFTKQFDTYTFTGNETWTYYNTGTAETDPFWYVNNICSGAVTAGVSYLSNGKIGTVFNNGQLRVRLSVNSGITDSSDMNNIFPVGTKLVYQLAEPVTSQYNPTTIPTVDIYNTALQTAGTRPCGLSLTYDGKDQTITLNPSHTYVFNDNQEDDSVITGQSSIEAVGGEDQLVDITQLYNGDATKIANIHSWASLSTRFHRYRDFQPYNPGTVEPDCPVIRKFDNEHAYGIIYDPSQNTPACQWVELNNGVLTEVSSFSDFSEIPCHELQRCVMDDLANRHVAYYLDDEDSDKKYNGTRNGVTSDGSASVLTGADGDVETEMPIGYWDLDEDWEGTGKRRWLISDRPFMGSYYPAEIHDFFYVSPDGSTPRKQYVGSYRGCICDADGNPLNTTEGALAQVTGTASTNKVRSIKGALPYVSVSLNDFTVKSGRNGGSSVNVKYHQWLFLLMAIEYGTLDNQAISYGYAGGIQNAFCFWRKSGRVNAGNGTASITAVEGTQDMDNFQKFTIGSTTVQRDTLMDADGRYAWSVYNRNASSTRYFTSSPTPSNGDPVYTASTGTTTAGTVASYTLQSNRTIQFQYRGIENPFGEVWEFEHGIQKFQTGSLKSFRGTDNLTYTRDPLGDGPSSYAWKNTSDTVLWTNTAAPGTSTTMYSDSSLTTATTVKYKDQPVYRYSSEGYWETIATDDYTMTSQRTAANPVYTVRHNHWPMSGWDTKFDPVTFFMRKTGSPGASGRYLPDYWYNDGGVGDRVAFVGGFVSYGSYDGMAYRILNYGLGHAGVYLSGRPSA